jgi:hypothetical protein
VGLQRRPLERVNQSRVNQSRVNQSRVNQSRVNQSRVNQSRVASAFRRKIIGRIDLPPAGGSHKFNLFTPQIRFIHTLFLGLPARGNGRPQGLRYQPRE